MCESNILVAAFREITEQTCRCQTEADILQPSQAREAACSAVDEILWQTELLVTLQPNVAEIQE